MPSQDTSSTGISLIARGQFNFLELWKHENHCLDPSTLKLAAVQLSSHWTSFITLPIEHFVHPSVWLREKVGASSLGSVQISGHCQGAQMLVSFPYKNKQGCSPPEICILLLHNFLACSTARSTARSTVGGSDDHIPLPPACLVPARSACSCKG